MPALVRDVQVSALTAAVSRLLIESNYRIPPDVLDALRAAVDREQSTFGQGHAAPPDTEL